MSHKLGYASTSDLINLNDFINFASFKVNHFSFHLTQIHYYLLSGFRKRYKLETYPKCDLSNLIGCRRLRWNNNFILHTKIAQRLNQTESDENKSEKSKKLKWFFLMKSTFCLFPNFTTCLFHQKIKVRHKR